MKAKIIILLLVSFIGFSQNENKLDQLGLTGSVKMLKMRCFKALMENDKIVKVEPLIVPREDHLDIDITFNISGNQIDEYVYTSKGGFYSKSSTHYDRYNNKIEHINYNSDLSIQYKRTYKYEKSREIENSFYKNGNKLVAKGIIQYDQSGNKVSEISYNSKNVVIDIMNYIYDDNKNLIEEINLDANNNPSYRKTFEYDLKNNLIEHTGYFKDSTIQYINKSKFDNKNNEIEFKKYSADGNLSYGDTYSYNDKNLKVKKEEINL
ncbi:hypothetical protein ACJRPK_13345 [Aquimarina sp. 2-A2]|uniref:hypothetical protein n=1 Tax=Aquimarina sp. 2-A2 TaxID=3382644 RepID=UPI00387F3358